jgi:hypothetical protein
MLAPQLLLHSDVLRPTVGPVTNDGVAKPRGGLWTSTYHPRYGSAWVQWCVAYRYGDPFELTWTVCKTPDSARIAVIDSAEELEVLIGK